MAAPFVQGSHLYIARGNTLEKWTTDDPPVFVDSVSLWPPLAENLPAVWRVYGGNIYFAGMFGGQARLYGVTESPFSATLLASVSGYYICGFNGQYVLLYRSWPLPFVFQKFNLATEAAESASAPPLPPNTGGGLFPTADGTPYVFGSEAFYRGQLDASGDVTAWEWYADVRRPRDYYVASDVYSSVGVQPFQEAPALIVRRPVSGLAVRHAVVDIDLYYPDATRMVKR